MKVYRYQIERREGALIQVESGGGAGYADCHPWVALWDAPLEEQLRDFENPLIKRAIELAHIDAEARAKKIDLFANLTLPQSYQQISLPCVTTEPVVKIKMGSDPTPLIEFMKHNPSRVRLDFNNRLNHDLFREFLDQVDLSRIDYVEDPYPFDSTWEEAPVKLAIDRDSHLYLNENIDFYIVKPALQDLSLFQKHLDKVVVTSYLGHPVGTAHSIYQAAKWGIKNLCGLSTPLFQPGTGIGFDQYLAELEWTTL